MKESITSNIDLIALVATFKKPVAPCGEWRQGWTTLI
jgi:hypothetical protein